MQLWRPLCKEFFLFASLRLAGALRKRRQEPGQLTVGQATHLLAQTLAPIVRIFTKKTDRMAELAQPQLHFGVIGRHGQRLGALAALQLGQLGAHERRRRIHG